MEGKQYFSLVMYGFCSNNTFYSASPLSFMVFIFVLTPFDTWDWMLLFYLREKAPCPMFDRVMNMSAYFQICSKLIVKTGWYHDPI